MGDVAFARADLGLAWAVKQSFVDYVEGMGDGRIMLGEGAAATATGQFYFPFSRTETIGEGAFVALFTGAVRFAAHFGMMSVTFRNPRIEVDSNGAILSIEQSGAWVRLAALALPEVVVGDGVTMWAEAAATLTETGVPMFAANYAAGTPLAPVTLRIPTPVAVEV